MDDQAPTTPPPGERPQNAEDPVPDPHRTEPAPEPQEGTRPGTDPAVRPEQDEPNGPLAGLMTAASAQTQEEAAEAVGGDDPESEALLARMGVEEENIESGQLLGLVAATLTAVAALAVILIYLFYVPYRTQVGVNADARASNYEQQNLRTEATAKLDQYSRTDSTYGVPVAQAMGLVAARYGSADAAGLPSTRQEWNMLAVVRGPGQAVQQTAATPRQTLPADAMPADGDEEVGVDDDVDTVEVVDDDDAEADDLE